MKTPFKKDPEGMYSDVPFDPYHNLKDYSLEELERLYETLVKRDVAADENPAIDEEYETYGIDREAFKIRLEEEIKARRNQMKGK